MQTGEHEQTPLKPDTGAQEQGIRPLRFENRSTVWLPN
jgi:hypothetical protein